MTLEELKEKLTNKKSWRTIGEILAANLSTGFVLAFLSLAVYSGYFWYEYVYHPVWSESRKQAYIKSRDNGTVFNESRLNEIAAERITRMDNFQKNLENIPDIFRLKQ